MENGATIKIKWGAITALLMLVCVVGTLIADRISVAKENAVSETKEAQTEQRLRKFETDLREDERNSVTREEWKSFAEDMRTQMAEIRRLLTEEDGRRKR